VFDTIDPLVKIAKGSEKQLINAAQVLDKIRIDLTMAENKNPLFTKILQKL
jgi:hypothetical protein